MDYKELALHIASSKKSHRQGKRWAAKYLAGRPNRLELKRVVENSDHENTEFGDENRRNSVRILSGENEYINVLCPQCKKPHRELLPVEYIQSLNAWRKNNILGDAPLKTRRFTFDMHVIIIYHSNREA
jgi:hypothetical protein